MSQPGIPSAARSRSRLGARTLLATLLGLALAAGATAETPRIYKWVDANGIAHYTTDPERIPRALRNRIRSTERTREPAPPAEAPQAAAPAPGPAPTPAPAPEIAVPAPDTEVASDLWLTRNAAPRVRSESGVLAAGSASPEALAALDARIAEVELEIARDEDVLKDLISDPELDEDVPLFDRPEFLEISKRLPQLQAKLQELRDERAQLETP